MARAARRVIVEEANPLLMRTDIHNVVKRLNVCAYARVSTDEVEQISSYNAQVQYYNGYIRNHDNWNLVDIFTDEGISGTNTTKRNGFNKMIKMCKQGKIDLIITKSVSRFARNTVDSLKTCRELKNRGIGVIFEKENINTLNDDIEIQLAIASSMAQEESRSISENVRWGFKRKFENGGIMVVTSGFMGYDMDDDGKLVINEEQAEVVKQIFNLFLMGHSYSHIAKHLTDKGIKTIHDKERWKPTVIKKMLQNEKYVGNCISQKTYISDFLTHKKEINKGQLPRYIIEDNHEAIIDKNAFIRAQERITEIDAKWAQRRGQKTVGSKYPLSNVLVCGKCGSPMRRKTWKKRNGDTEVKYACKERMRRNGNCKNGYVSEIQAQQVVMEAIMEFKEEESIMPYDEEQVRVYVERVIVRNQKQIDVYFKGGFTISKGI